MKVYVIFVQTKTYQEIGGVYTSLEEAQKEVIYWEVQLRNVFCPTIRIIERTLEEKCNVVTAIN